jgi:chaperonin GroES
VNTSGMDLRVLVKPDPAETKTAGGIILPDAHKDREKFAQTKATVVAMGENAFEEAISRFPGFVRPEAGARVLIGKYSGDNILGLDGQEYRIVNDVDLIARLEE